MDRFFRESIGLSYDSLISDIFSSWAGNGNPPHPPFENLIIKVMLLVNDTASLQCSHHCQLMKETISSPWYNFPRRRRYLMKSVFEWHALQDGFVRLLEQMNFSVRPTLLHLAHKLLTIVSSGRREPTASHASASHTSNVAPDCCRKHHTFRVPARTLCPTRKDLRILVPCTGHRNAPRVHRGRSCRIATRYSVCGLKASAR